MRHRKDFASASAGIRTPQRMQTPIRSDRCEHCGTILTENPISMWEIVANTICGSVLLAVLVLAGFVAYRWIDRGALFENPIWHVPLEDWSR